VIMELGRFGGRYLDNPKRGDRFDLGWALLSLKRRYRPSSLEGRLIAIEAGARHFELQGQGTYLSVQERPCPTAEIRVRGEPGAIVAWLFADSEVGVEVEGAAKAMVRNAFG